MTFTDPIDFEEAMEVLAARDPLPTDLSSAEIRTEWTPELRERSIFSARTTKGELLQGYKDQFAEILHGQTNTASARHEIQRLLKSMDYISELGGFPGDTSPPAERGSLRDLASNSRVDLVLKTNVRQIASAAQEKAGQTDSALYWYPAYELIRIAPRRVPRGQKLARGGKGTQPHLVSDPGKDWPSRWEKAGGEFYGGRMIALKGADVWRKLGDSTLFPDALDAPRPPFALNSGWGWRAVPRRVCLALGVIRGDAKPSPVDVRINAGLRASVKNLDASTLTAIRSNLATRLEGTQLLANAAWDEQKHPRGGGGRFSRSAIARDIKAVRRAIRIARGQKRNVPNALRRGHLTIDLDHGVPGDAGWGVEHFAKHPKDAHRAPVTLARGSIHPHEESHKLYVVRGNDVAILSQQVRKDGGRTPNRYAVISHHKNPTAAHRAIQRAAVVEGR